MRDDLWKFTLVLLFGTVCGYVAGFPWQGALLACIAIVGWQMHRFHKLLQWIRNPNNCPMPESTGQLYAIHRELSRKNRATKMRSRQLTRLFSQFRQAVGALPDTIILIDRVGHIQWANNNAEDTFGIRWPADANVRFSNLVRNPNLESLLSTDLTPVQQSLLEPKQPTDRPQSLEIKSPANPDRILNVKLIPYTDDLRMVLAQDVTRLMKINQMHSDFVANVSHELKTPLTVLRGYLEILESNPKLEPSTRRPIEQMARQNERMQMIVQDLLFLSRLEEKPQQGFTEPVDVARVVNSIVESIQPQILEKSQNLSLAVDAQLGLIGQQTELHSAFSNLIVNASAYTPSGGDISITWQTTSDGAEFVVTDNGPGIEAHHIPRLTQRFYRIDPDRSRQGGGTGLGLAIVKHVLQRHDAKLVIESEEGKGSTFRCCFSQAKLKILKQAEMQLAT